MLGWFKWGYHAAEKNKSTYSILLLSENPKSELHLLKPWNTKTRICKGTGHSKDSYKLKKTDCVSISTNFNPQKQTGKKKEKEKKLWDRNKERSYKKRLKTKQTNKQRQKKKKTTQENGKLHQGTVSKNWTLLAELWWSKVHYVLKIRHCPADVMNMVLRGYKLVF